MYDPPPTPPRPSRSPGKLRHGSLYERRPITTLQGDVISSTSKKVYTGERQAAAALNFQKRRSRAPALLHTRTEEQLVDGICIAGRQITAPGLSDGEICLLRHRTERTACGATRFRGVLGTPK